MKNKKLFAILTLVCFMFTLMPVAAFAADEKLTITQDATTGAITFTVTGVAAGEKATITNRLTGQTMETIEADEDGVAEVETPAYFYVNVEPQDVVFSVASGSTATLTAEMIEVATEIAVTAGQIIAGAYDSNIDDATSTFVAEDGDQSVKLNETVVFELDVEDAAYDPAKGLVFIWAEEVAGKASSALVVEGAVAAGIDNVWAYYVENYADVNVSFIRSGEYTVYAAPAVDTEKADTNEVAELSKFDCEFSVINVKSGSVDPEDSYRANGEKADAVIDEVSVVPNNVFEEKVEVVFTVDGQPMKGKTIAIETNSASIEVSKSSDKTNSQGKIDFAIAASVEGEYEVIVSVDGLEWIIEVTVGNTAAAYIETVTEPTAPQALYDALADDAIEFVITDINGNIVTSEDAEGMEEIAARNDKYVVLTEAPADSDLESDDFAVRFNGENVWYLDTPVMDAEGDYAIKVILDNGAYATAEWTVKKFQTPVRMIIGTATNTVELGGSIGGKVQYMDANGVMKLATDADLAVTGYAVESVVGNAQFKLTAKDDEKYVGSVITATAVSEKYDLVATAEFTVAEGATAIEFVDVDAEVDVNNKITWNIVDAAGNKVALGNGVDVDSIKYVVLDDGDAKVSVRDITIESDLTSKGEGKMALTSNKVGNVEVQVIVKAVYASTDDETANQIKYYTGTATIAVGQDGNGDVLVMSIGSNEYVINNEVKAMDAKAIIKDSRTFVPLRTGLEALGAEVAWDEATQSVTAEMNGVVVVMTIGSTEYTINGVAKTMDVAPYVDAEVSRTMVPASFAAYAFGMDVDYTTNDDGTVADVIFAN